MKCSIMLHFICVFTVCQNTYLGVSSIQRFKIALKFIFVCFIDVSVGMRSVLVRTSCDIQIDGRQGAGRPKHTWKKLTEKDCLEWKLMTVEPKKRSTWRPGVRSAMCAASQLPGCG